MLTECFLTSIQVQRTEIPTPELYPFSIPALKSLGALDMHPKITFFVGENGSGKSTLLEAIAIAAGNNPEGGSKNFRFESKASHSELHQYLRLIRGIKKPKDGFFLRAESLFTLSTEIERLEAEGPMPFASYGGRSLHLQSHGESFLSLCDHRLRGNGLYILDEPEAALSPMRQMSLLSILHRLIQQKSQFIIATHSPILLAYPDACIYSFSEQGIAPIQYEETEHFRVTRDFLNRRERMLKTLLSD